jgi:hypothetical protein
MKNKKKDFIQYLFHDDEHEEVDNVLEPILHSIGYVVMYFNALEQSLNHIICNILSDRADNFGLIVLHKMNFSNKVDLFKRFCDDFHSSTEMETEIFETLLHDLKESGRLRNLVIHANWEDTDSDVYTYINLKISKNGIHQEYIQFSEDSLTEIILLIMNTQKKLYEYWDERYDYLNK